MCRVVALLLQYLRNCRLGRRQALLLIRWLTRLNGFIPKIGRQIVIHLCRDQRGHPPHTRWHRRKFEPGSRGITSRHHHAARGCARTGTRIRLPKHRAFGGKTVDAGGLQLTASNPPTKSRDVVEAQIIGNNQNNVGRLLIVGDGCRNRALLPGNWPIFGDVIFVFRGVLHHGQQHLNSLRPRHAHRDYSDQKNREEHFFHWSVSFSQSPWKPVVSILI